MKWKQIDKYAIESGQWSIAKAYLDGCTMYSLHKNGGDAISFSEDVDVLKKLASDKNN